MSIWDATPEMKQLEQTLLACEEGLRLISLRLNESGIVGAAATATAAANQVGPYMHCLDQAYKHYQAGELCSKADYEQETAVLQGAAAAFDAVVTDLVQRGFKSLMKKEGVEIDWSEQ